MLVVGDAIGIRFTFPEGRNNTTPCEVVAQWTANAPRAVAGFFRDWRRTADHPGALPPPRSLIKKFAELPVAQRLAGAPHFHLWGPAMFSMHDVPRKQWPGSEG